MTQELIDLSTIKALTLVRGGLTQHDACAATGADVQQLTRMQEAFADIGDDVVHYLAWLRVDTEALRRRIALHAKSNRTLSAD